MAKACPDFAPLVEGNCMDPEPLEQPIAEELRQLTNPKQWLMALHLTCTYLAVKNVDKVNSPSPCHSVCMQMQVQHLANGLQILIAWWLCRPSW